ncbi:DUF1772 domain-containing protein [Mycetocola sp. 2940]|uniref:DUF1772 domain-containing protein n=1 Tax=Mycetocola sp. 2940 TaxID=3156452 RepID=UPI00339AF40B
MNNGLPAVLERATPGVLFVSLLLVGLTAGSFLATQLGQVRVQSRLDARDFVLVKRSFEEALGRMMPALTIAAGASLLLLVMTVWSTGPVRLTLASLAALCWIGAVVATLVLNAPVNALATEWSQESPPANWEALRDQWHLGQTIRTPLAVVSFALVTLTAVLPGMGPE